MWKLLTKLLDRTISGENKKLHLNGEYLPALNRDKKHHLLFFRINQTQADGTPYPFNAETTKFLHISKFASMNFVLLEINTLTSHFEESSNFWTPLTIEKLSQNLVRWQQLFYGLWATCLQKKKSNENVNKSPKSPKINYFLFRCFCYSSGRQFCLYYEKMKKA